MRTQSFAALFISLAAVGIAAAEERSPAKDEATAAKRGGNWLTRWWPFGGKSEEKKDAPLKDAAPAPESAGAVRARELAALQRRQAVCLKLKEIAIQTNDEALMQKAERLDQLAWRVYEQRTAGSKVLTETTR